LKLLIFIQKSTSQGRDFKKVIPKEIMENYWPTAGDKPTATKHDIEHSKWYKKVHFVNPIILGRGIPLFVDIQDKIKLKLLNTQQFTCGVTELNYIVDRQ